MQVGSKFLKVVIMLTCCSDFHIDDGLYISSRPTVQTVVVASRMK